MGPVIAVNGAADSVDVLLLRIIHAFANRVSLARFRTLFRRSVGRLQKRSLILRHVVTGQGACTALLWARSQRRRPLHVHAYVLAKPPKPRTLPR